MPPKIAPKQIPNKDCRQAAQQLQKYRDKPQKLINEVDRQCRKKNIPMEWHQTGSHVVGQTDVGDVVIPNHGEIPQGTFMSIVKMLVAIGVLAILLGCGYLFYMTTIAHAAGGG